MCLIALILGLAGTAHAAYDPDSLLHITASGSNYQSQQDVWGINDDVIYIAWCGCCIEPADTDAHHFAYFGLSDFDERIVDECQSDEGIQRDIIENEIFWWVSVDTSTVEMLTASCTGGKSNNRTFKVVETSTLKINGNDFAGDTHYYESTDTDMLLTTTTDPYADTSEFRPNFIIWNGNPITEGSQLERLINASPPRALPVSVHAGAGPVISGDLVFYKVQLLSLGFLTDHGVLCDETEVFADSGDGYPIPEWRLDSEPCSPISHNFGDTVSVVACVKVEPEGIHFKIVGDGPAYLDFEDTDCLSTGGPQNITMQAAAPLPAHVDHLQHDISWTITLTDPETDIEIGPITTGTHDIMLTYDERMPSAGQATYIRMDWCVDAADGATDAEEVADGIQAGLGGDPPYEPGEKAGVGNGWELLDGDTYGECDEQADLMVHAVEMMGINGTVRLVKASSDSYCLDQESDEMEDDTWVWLILDFNSGAGYNWNAFEGCCETASHYYAVWPQVKSDNDLDMLRDLGCQQYWVKTYNDTMPGLSGCAVETVYDEETIP
jgi:hypothetical protein